MNTLVVILRFVHIFAGVFWAGAAIMMGAFIAPTIRSTDKSGQAFAQHLLLKTPFNNAIMGSAILSVLAGAVLYWIDSSGFTSEWMSSGPGITFGVGAFFGLVAFVLGGMIGQNNLKLAKLGASLQGPPDEEQLSQIQAIQKKLASIGPSQLISIILATVLMAVARYVHF